MKKVIIVLQRLKKIMVNVLGLRKREEELSSSTSLLIGGSTNLVRRRICGAMGEMRPRCVIR